MSKPGDILWVSQHDFTARMIQFAQSVKYKGSPAARFNHVAMITDAFGGLIQANQSGVERGTLLNYYGQDVEIRRPPYTETAVPATAAMHELLGDKYGNLTIASVALSLLTGTKLRFGLSGTEICSGLVSYALTRANVDMGLDCEFNTPADCMAIAISQGWANVGIS